MAFPQATACRAEIPGSTGQLSGKTVPDRPIYDAKCILDYATAHNNVLREDISAVLTEELL